MSALEERPVAPAPDPAMKWIAGCGFGCLALIVLVVVAAVAAVTWLSREGPPRPEERLADGREASALTVDLRPDDAAVTDLLAGMRERALEVSSSQTPVKLPDLFRRLGREDVTSSLPLRFELLRWRGAEEEGAAPWLVRLTLGKGGWKARFGLRMVGWMAGRNRANARRESIDGVEVFVAGSEQGSVAAAAVSNRVLLSNDEAVLRRTLAVGGRAAQDATAAAETEALRLALAVDGEDGRGYLRPVGPFSTPEGAPPIALAAVSLDVASRDAVRFRAAVRCAGEPSDRKAAAAALEAWVTGFPLLNDVRIVREGEPYWLDPATLVVEGRIEGLEGLFGSFFSASEDAASP